jgi:hypothetical protein
MKKLVDKIVNGPGAGWEDVIFLTIAIVLMAWGTLSNPSTINIVVVGIFIFLDLLVIALIIHAAQKKSKGA